MIQYETVTRWRREAPPFCLGRYSCRDFEDEMELYLIDDYNEIYPELKNAALTDALVTDLLRDNGWVTDGPIRIERLPGGKPVLARDASGATDDSGASGAQVHFSVSHTGHLFGCVISDEPVGLDIQMMTRANARRLAERYFTEAEIAWIEAGCEAAPADTQEAPDPARETMAPDTGFRERFFRLWCRKEAYSKLTGEGLAVVARKEPVVDRPDLEFTDLVLGDGIYGCICCK